VIGKFVGRSRAFGQERDPRDEETEESRTAAKPYRGSRGRRRIYPKPPWGFDSRQRRRQRRTKELGKKGGRLLDIQRIMSKGRLPDHETYKGARKVRRAP